VFKTNTKTRVFIGLFSIVCLLTIVSITNYSNIIAKELSVMDTKDPGNSLGPGIDPSISPSKVLPVINTKDLGNSPGPGLDPGNGLGSEFSAIDTKDPGNSPGPG